ncbi:MAG TPA: glycosyltransferase, partial [Acidimicrobiales bacterium]|nr:glycosyltransferase [Acidimicrobiales bacterium]
GGADVVSLASVWEGQPTVVLEAMAAGVAVVATSCVGTADTVVDGVTGLLAPPRDPDGLASALARATDGALRDRLARAAGATVPDHLPDVVAAAHLAAFERVLEGRWPSVTS